MSANTAVFIKKQQVIARKLQTKLGLKAKPHVSVICRRFLKLDSDGFCQFEPLVDVIETIEDNKFENHINSLEKYGELSLELNTKRKYGTYLIEVLVEFGTIKASAGCIWIFEGILKSKERFAAVLSLYVMEIFRGCKISTLLKLKEIELAKKNKCDFIQTFHESENPYFAAAIVPSLKNGFILYHGRDTGEELYEDNGYVHLRKYFNIQNYSSSVVIKGVAKPVKSPEQNKVIIETLRKTDVKYPGMIIKVIKTRKIK